MVSGGCEFWANGLPSGEWGGGGLYHAHNVSDMGPCDSWVFFVSFKRTNRVKANNNYSMQENIQIFNF